MFGTAALLFLMRRRIGGIEGRKTLSVVVRVAIASGAVAAVAYFVWEPLDSALGRSIPGQTVSLTAALLASTGVYLLICRLLRVRELDALRGLIARRAD
jgi:putative peptidoglycan lipid II flippase